MNKEHPFWQSYLNLLDSLETVIQAVKSNYPERQTYIFGKMAKSILSWDSNNEFDYPIELQEHICYLQDS